jgi:hypothetical protein
VVRPSTFFTHREVLRDDPWLEKRLPTPLFSTFLYHTAAVLKMHGPLDLSRFPLGLQLFAGGAGGERSGGDLAERVVSGGVSAAVNWQSEDVVPASF